MNLFVAIFAILAVFASASGFVIPESTEAGYGNQMVRLEDVDTDGGIQAADPTDMIIRHRRLTCDSFSFSWKVVTPNHSACALQCVRMGRGGGHCEGATCVCRNDKWSPW